MLLLVLIVAMLLGVLGPKLFAPSQWEHRFKVGLGLDLSSGTQVTLRAQTLSGKAPSSDEMNPTSSSQVPYRGLESSNGCRARGA